jgi:GNAT superfamily N-acetyltransferase
MSLQWGGEASALDVEAFGYFQAWDATQWGRSTGYVAVVEGQVLGALSYVLMPAGEKTRPLIWVCKMAINQAHRRQGFGTALIDRVKEKAKYGRTAWLTTFVPEELLEAQLFFQSCKFRAVPPVRAGWMDNRPSYFMRYRVLGRGPHKKDVEKE